MATIAKSPKEAVVSVWSGGVGSGTYIGSAFFVSPSMLLTAKHVLQHGNGELFEKLCLGLVQDEHQVCFNAKNIVRHPEKDVAVIKLDHPNEKQPFCRLNLNTVDYRSYTADSFGIHKDNQCRDETSHYTVGSLDREAGGYCYDTAVKPGFSGGPVSLHEKPEAIGIVIQRDVKEQETLFIPLYDCKDWLEDIHRQFPDAGLAGYFNHDKPSASQDYTTGQINRQILEMAVFIGRPEEAYKHFLNELIQSKAVVKACLCLYSSNKDKPALFAESLAVRLGAGLTSRLEPGLLAARESFDLKRLVTNPWDFDNKESFYATCLETIWDILRISSEQPAASTANRLAILQKGVLSKLSNRNMPVVFVSHGSIKPVKTGWFGLAKSQVVNKINERFEWIKQFNQQWRKLLDEYLLTANPDIQPMVILFCIQVEDKLADTAKRCFRLNKITVREFEPWVNAVHNLLSESNQFNKRAVNKQIDEFSEIFIKSVSFDNTGFALTYDQFYKQTEQLTQLRKDS